MPRQTFHAVIYKDARNDRWAVYCVEYDVASQGDSAEQALEMIQEAMELHFEESDDAIIEQVDNQVGSRPMLVEFEADVPVFPARAPVADSDDLMNPKVLQAILRQAGLSFSDLEAALDFEPDDEE